MHARILLAVDESPASERAVAYVAEMSAGRPEQYVHLVHVTAPGEPASETEASKQLLSAMQAQLVAAGIQDDHVDKGMLTVPNQEDFVDALLDAARDQSCDTIVVGRTSLPWYREAFHHHPADELVRRAKGFTLWVVE